MDEDGCGEEKGVVQTAPENSFQKRLLRRPICQNTTDLHLAQKEQRFSPAGRSVQRLGDGGRSEGPT